MEYTNRLLTGSGEERDWQVVRVHARGTGGRLDGRMTHASSVHVRERGRARAPALDANLAGPLRQIVGEHDWNTLSKYISQSAELNDWKERRRTQKGYFQRKITSYGQEDGKRNLAVHVYIFVSTNTFWLSFPEGINPSQVVNSQSRGLLRIYSYNNTSDNFKPILNWLQNCSGRKFCRSDKRKLTGRIWL